jgi:hypothetical protein
MKRVTVGNNKRRTAIPVLLLLVVSLCSTVSAEQETDIFWPGDQSLFFMPTAYTMPQGSHAFTMYEVIYWQYTYALTNSTHLSASTFMPFFVSGVVEGFAAGIKQNYLKTEMVQAAAAIGYSPYFERALVSNIVSIGSDRISIHAGGILLTDFTEWSNYHIFMAGARLRVSNTLGLMGELYAPKWELDDYERFEQSAVSACVTISNGTARVDAGVMTTLQDKKDKPVAPLFKISLMF